MIESTWQVVGIVVKHNHVVIVSVLVWVYFTILFFVFNLIPDDHETLSEVAYPSQRSRFGKPARSSSSKAMIPLHRLGTLEEVPSTDVLNEESSSTGEGVFRTNSSYSDSRVPCPRRLNSSFDDNNSSVDDLRNVHEEDGVEQVGQRQPSSPAPGWEAESRETTARNPLLRRPQWNPKKK